MTFEIVLTIRIESMEGGISLDDLAKYVGSLEKAIKEDWMGASITINSIGAVR